MLTIFGVHGKLIVNARAVPSFARRHPAPSDASPRYKDNGVSSPKLGLACRRRLSREATASRWSTRPLAPARALNGLLCSVDADYGNNPAT